MATLVCKFADQIRFLDQISNQDDRGLFIETDLDLATGTETDVEIHFASGDAVAAGRAKVVARRAKATPRQQPGGFHGQC